MAADGENHSTVRITASRAKGEYGLNESDLDQLDCDLVRNPHYRSAAPMRLYLMTDVQAAAETKRQIAAMRPTPEQVAQERQIRAKAAAAEAAARVLALGSECQNHDGRLAGCTPLSIDAWVAILSALARDRDCIRDTCVVAADMCKAALVCRDLRLASIDALRWLQRTDVTPVAPLTPCPSADLEIAAQDPQSMTIPRLKAVCSELQLHVTGTKAVLIMRILDALGIPRPSRTIPVRLLMLAHTQRNTLLCTRTAYDSTMYKDPSLYRIVVEHNHKLIRIPYSSDDASIWLVRRKLVELHGTEAAYNAKIQARDEAVRIQREQERTRQAEQAKHRYRVAGVPGLDQLMCPHCVYKNYASRDCAQLRCGRCCEQLNCRRHR